MRIQALGRALLAGLFLLAGAGTLAGQEPSGARCFVPDTALAKRGQSLFTSKGCIACHSIGGGERAGPDLAGVTRQRDHAWLRRWLKDPIGMLKTDSIAKALLARYNNIPMPNLQLKDDEVEALLHYMAQEGTRVSGGGSEGKCP